MKTLLENLRHYYQPNQSAFWYGVAVALLPVWYLVVPRGARQLVAVFRWVMRRRGMGPVVENLKLFYQPRHPGFWGVLAALSVGVWCVGFSAICTANHLTSPEFFSFLLLMIVVPAATVALGVEQSAWNKPFAFALPGRGATVRQAVFVIAGALGLLFSILFFCCLEGSLAARALVSLSVGMAVAAAFLAQFCGFGTFGGVVILDMIVSDRAHGSSFLGTLALLHPAACVLVCLVGFALAWRILPQFRYSLSERKTSAGGPAGSGKGLAVEKPAFADRLLSRADATTPLGKVRQELGRILYPILVQNGPKGLAATVLPFLIFVGCFFALSDVQTPIERRDIQFSMFVGVLLVFCLGGKGRSAFLFLPLWGAGGRRVGFRREVAHGVLESAFVLLGVALLVGFCRAAFPLVWSVWWRGSALSLSVPSLRAVLAVVPFIPLVLLGRLLAPIVDFNRAGYLAVAPLPLQMLFSVWAVGRPDSPLAILIGANWLLYFLGAFYVSRRCDLAVHANGRR